MGEILRVLLIGLMLIVGGGIVRAEPLDDGIAASKRGDYATALRFIRPPADQGGASAQYNFAAMYAKELSVSQDYVRSPMWLTLSEANGATNHIERAQKMAKRCEHSNYKQCDKQQEGSQTRSSAKSVSMHRESDGIYVVPVLINNAITLNLVLDSGASDVRIPADVVITLMRKAALKRADFQGKKTYTLADGSTVPSRTFRIRSLKVGGKVVENVNGSVASLGSGLLLGQSFLSRLKSWSVDNTKKTLVLE